MSWVVILIIALACLAVVLGICVYVGLKAWRLLKHALRISQAVAPLAEQLSRQATELQVNAERVAAQSEEISANLERLRMSIARLQIIGEAVSEAVTPYRRMREYLGK